MDNVKFGREKSTLSGAFDFVFRISVDMELQCIEFVGRMGDIHCSKVTNTWFFWFGLHT